MFLTEDEPSVGEKNEIDFKKGPYNNVLEPENSYSSSESQFNNNEKLGKCKKRKKESPQQECRFQKVVDEFF